MPLSNLLHLPPYCVYAMFLSFLPATHLLVCFPISLSVSYPVNGSHLQDSARLDAVDGDLTKAGGRIRRVTVAVDQQRSKNRGTTCFQAHTPPTVHKGSRPERDLVRFDCDLPGRRARVNPFQQWCKLG